MQNICNRQVGAENTNDFIPKAEFQEEQLSTLAIRVCSKVDEAQPSGIMDPLTALGVTCNVVDLVGTAINCGLAVKQVYDSVDGFKKEHEILRNAAENMSSVVRRLQDEKAEIALCTKDEKVEEITARCVTLCQELQTALEECRSKKRSILSASKATIKAALRSGKIDLLQKELDMCRKALHSMIALTTRCVTANVPEPTCSESCLIHCLTIIQY